MKNLKKIGVYILCILLLASLQAFADADCPRPVETKCPQTYQPDYCAGFLCRGADIEDVINGTGLDETQVCTARKLQEKYERETLSINDRIAYEESVLNGYQNSCGNNGDIRKQKKKIKKLKKSRKKICKCYEDQFRMTLSDTQWRKYKKIRK